MLPLKYECSIHLNVKLFIKHLNEVGSLDSVHNVISGVFKNLNCYLQQQTQAGEQISNVFFLAVNNQTVILHELEKNMLKYIFKII